MPKPAIKQMVLAALLLVGYVYVGYFIARTDTFLILTSFVFLFGIYIWIYNTVEDGSINQWITISILLRASLLFCIPNLSDDVYRYLWDGRLLANGIHPFSNVPEYFVSNTILPSILNQELFTKLNSPNYFTIYPPVAQGVFWLVAKVSADNIMVGIGVIRILIIGAEIGSIYLLKKLLTNFKLPAKNILLYALNPLVILELSGNLHLEAFMIFFLLLTVYLFTKERLMFSAIAFCFAICSKLIPLLFFPIILLSFRSLKKSVVFSVVVLIAGLILFIPVWDWGIVSGFSQSVSYYFKKFEFNASVYYLVREWGFWKYGYNIVQTVGWKLGLLSGTGVLIYSIVTHFKNQQLSINNQQLLKDWLWVYCIYLVFTTTLHPWYVLPLLAYSVFTNYRFTVLWSFLIFFTYGGYSLNGYTENLWIVIVEYLLVILFLIFELVSVRNSKVITEPI